MKSVTKAEWIAALRSGRYKQTKEALQDKNGFCCLGVLCDIAEVPIEKNIGDIITLTESETGNFGFGRSPSKVEKTIYIFGEDYWGGALFSEASLPVQGGARDMGGLVSDLQLNRPIKMTIDELGFQPGTEVALDALLMDMNDSDYSFEKIADFLEELA